jgi:hypothetical protein
MLVEEDTMASRRGTLRAGWVGQLLRLYPRAWRARYGAEVTELLLRHRVTLWTALDSPLAVVLQMSLVLLLLIAVAGSTAAVAVAVAHSDVGAGLLRFALLPAGVATAALAVGLLAGLALTALIFIEAPQVGFWPPLHFGDALVMLVAVLVATLGLRRGLRASRGVVGASAV